MNGKQLKDAIDDLELYTIILNMEIDRYKHFTDGLTCDLKDLEIDVRNLKTAIDKFEKAIKH